MAFIKVGEILTERFRPYHRQHVVVDAMAVCAAWRSVVEEVNCVEKFERTRAIAYRNGILTIQAASSLIASELKMCEYKIIAAYDKRFKQKIIERLVIKRA